MNRNSYLLRSIAFYLLINIVVALVFPSIASARIVHSTEQSALSSADVPEFVNLATGDFNYKLPVMTVPGFNLGYSIELNYNAGIQNQQNASWVGLGWNLSAGSVSRSISGHADDYDQALEITEDKWSGRLPDGNQIWNPGSNNQTAISGSANVHLAEFIGERGVSNSGILNAKNLGVENIDHSLLHDLSVADTMYFEKFNGDPKQMLGGILPSYDNYAVSGPGIGGMMEPLVLENGTLIGATQQRTWVVTDGYYGGIANKIFASYDYVKPFTKAKQQFRFKNEVSNRFLTTPDNITIGTICNPPTPCYPSLVYPNGSGKNRYTFSGPTDAGYDSTTLRLAGANHINYFTNAEINSNSAKQEGFINYPTSMNRSTFNTPSTIYRPNNDVNDISTQIGGFSITNPDGMTYHYALPVYTYGSQSISWSVNDFGGTNYHRVISNDPYAYDWLLTTVTGDDFVDANNNGIADEGDSGAWLNFNYGLWQNAYMDRTPYSGTIKGMDNSDFAKGSYKQIYYLDAVYSKSHTALFLKSLRSDNYGAANIFVDTTIKNIVVAKQLSGDYNSTTSKSVLKLESVNLYKNEDIISMSSASTNAFNKNIFESIQQIKKISTQKYIYTDYQNVLDMNDIYTSSGTLIPHFTIHNLLKRVAFTYDYSLAIQSLNSNTGGKLTLKSLNFFGKNEQKQKPSMDFEYELPSPKTFAGQVTYIPSDLSTIRDGRIDFGNTPNPFQEGDLVKFVVGGVTYHAALVRGMVSTPNGAHISVYDAHFLGVNIPDVSKKNISFTATQTKNPPYTKTHEDQWGYFKSNYLYTCASPLYGESGIENFDRRTDAISAQSVDAWSLRRIVNSSGSVLDIEYESDSHSNRTDNFVNGKRKPKGVVNIKEVGFTKNDGSTTFASPTNSFTINAINRLGTFQFKFKENFNCTDEFYVGQVVKIQTAATLNILGGPNHTNLPITFNGADLFKITAVSDNMTGNNSIQGVFIFDANNSPKTNPLAVTRYVYSTDLILGHHGSYIIYEPKQKYGGGLRVKKVKVSDTAIGDAFETQYGYTNKATGYTSGVTASEPLNYSGIPALDTLVVQWHYKDFTKAKQQYQTANLYTGFYNQLAYAYANPQVIYEYVTKKRIGNTVQSSVYNEYKFKVFSDDLLSKTVLNNVDDGTRAARTVNVENRTAIVGNLLSFKQYDAQNNLLTESTNVYEDSDLGIIEPVFHQIRYVDRNSVTGYATSLGIVTQLTEYPCVLKSVIEKNHVKGERNVSTINTRDFYIGEPIEISSTDSYGHTLTNVKQPAYHLYTSPATSGAEMGLKIKNKNNRHLLSKYIANYNYISGNNTGSLPFTITSIGSSTGTSFNRYKATLSSGTLPFSYVTNSYITMTLGGPSAEGYISYIYPDRKSFEFYIHYGYAGSTGVLTNVNMNTPLSSSIQPWTNNWQYRNYNTTTNQYENLTVTESSPANPNAYKKMWRPAAPYIWNSPFLNTDGSYKSSSTGAYVEFDWAAELASTAQTGTAAGYWQKGTQVTLKDEFSNTLEVKDVNGNYAATKMATDQSYLLKNPGGYTFTYPNTANYNNYVLSSGKNTNYASFAFSSFEEFTKPSGASTDQYGGEIQTTNVFGSQTAASTGIKPHSGNYSFKLASTATSTPFSASYKTANTEGNILVGKKYRASVWVHKNSSYNAGLYWSVVGNSGAINNYAFVNKNNSKIIVGDWTLLTIDFDVPANYTSVASTDLVTAYMWGGSSVDSYFDDFAVRPIDADQTSYVYDPLTKQVLYVIDKDGFYTRYQYDNTGRLIATYKETLAGEKKIATQEYNFAKP